jgi:glycosyltransferase involved in cell wall biosynthesis
MANKKRRILRILNRFNVGGPVYNATYLTKYIDSDLYETILIGGIPETHEQPADYILENEGVDFKKLKYMRRKISPLYDLISLIQIIHIIYKYRPDIIHTHAAKSGILGRIASLFYYKKVVVIHTYHGNVFDGYFSDFKNKMILFIERFLARHSSKIIAISTLQCNDLINKYKICEKDKVVVVPLGFDLNRFTQNIEIKRESSRIEFNVDEKTILITIIGRIVPIKNHKLFIDIFNYCKNKTSKRIKALIVGDGSETKEIINYVKEKGLSYSYKDLNKTCDFLFTSWRSDIDKVLSSSDILCLTSINEGTPVSIIEAMASKTACISTDVGGVSDIIDDGISGIVSSSVVNEFGEELLKMIENDSFRKELAEQGQSKSMKTFNYQVLVNNIESLYQHII